MLVLATKFGVIFFFFLPQKLMELQTEQKGGKEKILSEIMSDTEKI